MNGPSIGKWPIFMAIALSVGLANHVILLPVILSECGRDAWISSFMAFAAVLPWLLIVVHGTMKRTKHHRLTDLLSSRLSKPVALVIMLPVLLLMLMLSFQAYSETVDWTSTTYLPGTPPLVIQICLMVLLAYGVWSGIRPLTAMSTLLLPCVVVLGDFVMSVNMPDKDYRFLLPMLEHGSGGMLRASLYSAGSLMELFILLLLQHHIRVQLTKIQLTVLLLFIAMLTVGPAIGAVTEFGPVEAAKLRYPAFAQWRLVTIGRYIEHVDFFAIFQWLSGAFIRISMSLFIVMELLPFRRKLSRGAALAFICLAFIVTRQILANRVLNHMAFTKAIFIADVAVILTITLVLWLLSFTILREEGGNHARGERQAAEGGMDS